MRVGRQSGRAGRQPPVEAVVGRLLRATALRRSAAKDGYVASTIATPATFAQAGISIRIDTTTGGALGVLVPEAHDSSAGLTQAGLQRVGPSFYVPTTTKTVVMSVDNGAKSATLSADNGSFAIQLYGPR